MGDFLTICYDPNGPPSGNTNIQIVYYPDQKMHIIYVYIYK